MAQITDLFRHPDMGGLWDPILAIKLAGDVLLKKELEQLVVEAKRLGLDRKEVAEAIDDHWNRLDGTSRAARRKA